MKNLSFRLEDGKHVLQPNNSISELAQNLSFQYLEEEQYKFIQKYAELNDDEKYLNSNSISNFFVMCFLNGDGASFRRIVGDDHKGLMTVEELKNVKRDFEIALRKKNNGEFKTFLLLDIIPYSNRRADAVVVTNEYNIELYDFSEGIVSEKIKKVCDNQLKPSEIKQKHRKEKQNIRIESYKGKIKNNCETINDIIIDKEKVNVHYFDLNTEFYEFNYIYTLFKKGNYKTLYIPNSLCFLMTKENATFPFCALPLKHNIDSPLFITEEKPIIEEAILNDIYEKNIYIGISIIYAKLFITEFTYFKIHLSKKPQEFMEKHHLSLLTKSGKKKYVYLEDLRTNKWIPIGIGMINKHFFMNISLKSMMIYLAKLCNPEENDNFAHDIIKYEKLKNSEYDFFVLKN